jgi:hypothetical protein
MKSWLFFILMNFPLLVQAHTLAKHEVDDPILDGEKCLVQSQASVGSYIYSLPSKYDLVFWPLTDENGIWFCEKSGFTAIIDDFAELRPAERKNIKEYLLANPPRNSAINAKLELLENIYALRDTEAGFNNLLHRVLARWYQNIGDLDKANNYRKKALADIEVLLDGKLSELQRLTYLYIAANYTKQFGNEKASQNYLTELMLTVASVKSQDAKNFADYLNELAKDTQFIQVGGVLDPVMPK